jgi:hypothetical protein
MSHNPSVGLEIGTDGNLVGRDPRRMRRQELEELGHRPMSPAEALRARCLDCCGGSQQEVRFCPATDCPSWPFRMGKNPWKKSMSDDQLAAARTRAAQLNAARRQARQKSSAGAIDGAPEADGTPNPTVLEHARQKSSADVVEDSSESDGKVQLDVPGRTRQKSTPEAAMRPRPQASKAGCGEEQLPTPYKPPGPLVRAKNKTRSL